VGRLGVAGAENEAGLHVQVELVAQRGLHVDLGQHPEALVGQGLGGMRSTASA